jgi:hypothetical protein
MPSLTVSELEQLAQFDEHWRVVLEGDDPPVVWELCKSGYLEILRRRTPLFKLSQKGRKALQAMRKG